MTACALEDVLRVVVVARGRQPSAEAPKQCTCPGSGMVMLHPRAWSAHRGCGYGVRCWHQCQSANALPGAGSERYT